MALAPCNGPRCSSLQSQDAPAAFEDGPEHRTLSYATQTTLAVALRCTTDALALILRCECRRALPQEHTLERWRNVALVRRMPSRVGSSWAWGQSLRAELRDCAADPL